MLMGILRLTGILPKVAHETTLKVIVPCWIANWKMRIRSISLSILMRSVFLIVAFKSLSSGGNVINIKLCKTLQIILALRVKYYVFLYEVASKIVIVRIDQLLSTIMHNSSDHILVLLLYSYILIRCHSNIAVLCFLFLDLHLTDIAPRKLS